MIEKLTQNVGKIPIKPPLTNIIRDQRPNRGINQSNQMTRASGFDFQIQSLANNQNFWNFEQFCQLKFTKNLNKRMISIFGNTNICGCSELWLQQP